MTEEQKFWVWVAIWVVTSLVPWIWAWFKIGFRKGDDIGPLGLLIICLHLGPITWLFWIPLLKNK